MIPLKKPIKKSRSFIFSERFVCVKMMAFEGFFMYADEIGHQYCCLVSVR